MKDPRRKAMTAIHDTTRRKAAALKFPSMRGALGSGPKKKGFHPHLRRLDAQGKVSLAIVGTCLLLVLASLGPSIVNGSDEVEAPVRSADYGIFNRISALDAEEAGRTDDPLVVSQVESTLGSLETGSYVFEEGAYPQYQEQELDVPSPVTKSPVIFDALSQNPVINNTNILDWIVPPPLGEQGALNYLVYSRSGSRGVWKLASLVPKLGIYVDSSLDKWVYIDVDGNPGTGDGQGNDVRARMTFARDLLSRDWSVSLNPPAISFMNAGARIEIEALDPVNGMSQVGGKIYFVKGISYQDQNYVWALGISLDRFMDRLVLRVQAKEWRFEPSLESILRILGGGSVDLRDLRVLQILGPYSVSYQFQTPPEHMTAQVSVMRLYGRTLKDKAYVELSLSKDAYHERIVPTGKVLLNVNDMRSPIEGIEWAAGEDGSPEDTISLSIRYTEFSDDLIDAHISIPVLPHTLKLSLGTKSSGGRNLTVLDLSTPSGISSLDFLEVIYPRWERQPGFSDLNATMLTIRGIPKDLMIVTTASVPLDVNDDNTSGLNILDAFMRQIAGRFYRVGQILREIPRSIAEMPSRKGSTVLDCHGASIISLDYVFTKGGYLYGPVDHVSFYDPGTGTPAMSARLQGISFYSGYFNATGNDMTLRFSKGTDLAILASSPGSTAFVRLNDIPEEIKLHMDGSEISYQGFRDGKPAKLSSIEYRFRDEELLFDANIFDVPPSIRITKGPDNIKVRSESGPIGSLELFSSNSTSIPPLDIPEGNFIALTVREEGAAVGLRLNRLSSFLYNNRTNGFMELGTMVEANLYLILDDEVAGMRVDAAFVPLPSFVHLDFPAVIGRPDIGIPDLLGARSVSDYSDMLLSLRNLGRAPLIMASSISRGLIQAIGTYSTGISMSWGLSEKGGNLDLILDIKKYGMDPVGEARWTHGMWIEQTGLGENSSVNGKIFLSGMPRQGYINLSFSELVISTYLDFKEYRPEFDYILIRTSGVQDRDISVYMTGLQKGMNILLDLMIFTDLSVGGSMVVDMEAAITDLEGEALDLGEMLATLRKAAPILSIRQMYLPEVPSKFSLQAELATGVRAVYEAGKSIEYLYFKLTKLMDGRWSQIYSLFHDLPLKFDVNLTTNTDFSILKPLPLQGLPSIDLGTTSDDLDIFIEFDGSGFGQRGKFQIYADNIGSTRTYYDGDDYVIDSDGIGFLSVQVDRLPVLESFTLSSLTLLGRDLVHLRLSADMVYGVYPMIRATEAEGGSFQIKVSGQMNALGRSYSPELFFITIRTKDILSLGIVTGLSINKDTSALDMGRDDGAVILPAPMLTLWYWALSPILGGG